MKSTKWLPGWNKSERQTAASPSSCRPSKPPKESLAAPPPLSDPFHGSQALSETLEKTGVVDRGRATSVVNAG